MSCYRKNNCVGCPHYYNDSIEPKSCHAFDDIDCKFDIGDVVKWAGDEYVVQDVNFEGGKKVTYTCVSVNNPEIEGIFDENVLE